MDATDAAAQRGIDREHGAGPLAETGQTVALVDDGGRRAAAGVEAVAGARVAFERIAGAVGDIRSTIAEVASAAEDVVAVADRSSSATQQVSAAAEQTTASSEEIAASSQQLATMAEELSRLVGEFRLT